MPLAVLVSFLRSHHHLGYEKHNPVGNNTGNSRNGKFPKTIKSDPGQILIEVPRERNGSYEPRIVKKHQICFDGFDEKIISMYARGMSSSVLVE